MRRKHSKKKGSIIGQYESKAKHHLERIQYYHENAGPRGYAQAKYHYNELAKLQMVVQYSKKYKNEAPIIASFGKQAEPLMKEMKKWQDEWEKEE